MTRNDIYIYIICSVCGIYNISIFFLQEIFSFDASNPDDLSVWSHCCSWHLDDLQAKAGPQCQRFPLHWSCSKAQSGPLDFGLPVVTCNSTYRITDICNIMSASSVLAQQLGDETRRSRSMQLNNSQAQSMWSRRMSSSRGQRSGIVST